MMNQYEQIEKNGLEIAIVGMSGRFPGASDIDTYWSNLRDGVESIVFFSDTELEEVGVPESVRSMPNYIKAKGYLEDAEYFDAAFFGFRPAEAEMMDPQLRLFYQCAWHALEHAGYTPGRYDGAIGLYAGASANFFWNALNNFSGERDTSGAGGLAFAQLVDKNYLATGLSYKLNLKGPSFTLHTACSTSLVAVHLACQALLSGECGIAMAGGVSLLLPPKSGYIYQEGLIQSPDGYCRAFDKDANGTVFGNGCGVVVLKTLEDAIKHHDTIHAVIKGSAVNNDGSRKVGYTAPSTKGQAEVIRAAYNAAEVSPESVTYIEAHGTGTSLGDPIEIEALKLAFGSSKKQICAIGSVKPNIGHLDAAAGVAGLIKTVMAMKHRQIPPSLHVNVPNPKIDFQSTPFFVNTSLNPWHPAQGQSVLRGGVSSFGVGGTNAHIVLEEAPPVIEEESANDRGRDYFLLPISAKSSQALNRLILGVSAYFKDNIDLSIANAAYTLQVGREGFPHRAAVVCRSLEEARLALENKESGKLKIFHASQGSPVLVFMCSGQGSQYENMGKELYEKEPIFRAELDRCLDTLNSLSTIDFKEILFPPPADTDSMSSSLDDTPNEVSPIDSGGPPSGAVSPSEQDSVDKIESSDKLKIVSSTENPDINQTQATQPLLFSFEYALAKLLISWGYKPDTLIGHSIGEFTAVCLSGALSLEEALAIVYWRGKLMQDMQPGSMLSVKMTEEQLAPFLSQWKDIELAAVNGPNLCVLSGSDEEIDRVAAKLEQDNYRCRKLHTSHAFHSQSMEPMLDAFKQKVAEILEKNNGPERTLKIPLISNVTGKRLTIDQIMDPSYWVTHLRRTVRFSAGLEELFKSPEAVFVEVGPGRTLSTFVQQHPAKKAGHQMLNLVRHPHEQVSDVQYLMEKVAQLWICGLDADWKSFHRQMGTRHHRIPMPLYPFEKRRYWKLIDRFIKSGQAMFPGQGVGQGPRTIGGISDWFYRPFWRQKDRLPHLDTDDFQNSWLVFTDSSEAASSLISVLESTSENVLKVESHTDDFSVVVEQIRHWPQEQPLKLLFLWNADFQRIVRIVQTLDGLKIGQSMELVILTSHCYDITGQDALDVKHSLLTGLLKVIPQEYPSIRCRLIDTAASQELLPEMNRFNLDVLEELRVPAAAAEPEIVIRNGIRWVLEFEPIVLDEAVKQKNPPRQQGVWLITGGLGGIGLAMAEYLAQTVKARLVLTGRSQFPPENQWSEWIDSHDENDPTSYKIKRLLSIQQAGSEVMIVRSDAANRAQMEDLINAIDTRFNGLHGVIHAAGALDDTAFLMIPQLTDEKVSRQFAPKVTGTEVLDEVLKGRELDTCLLTSSLSAVLGGLGYGAYAAANSFQDAYVCKHNQQSSQHWISVNLDAWDTRHIGGESSTSITPEEGVDVLARIIAWNKGNRLVVSKTDLEPRIQRWIRMPDTSNEEVNEVEDANLSEDGPQQERPRLSTPYVEPQSEMEQTLAEVWQEFFGIDRVGIHDNFFDLGATSLDLVQLSAKFKKATGRDVPVVNLFRYPMISALAQFLGQDDDKNNSMAHAESQKEKQAKRAGEVQKGRRSMQNRRQLIKNK